MPRQDSAAHLTEAARLLRHAAKRIRVLRWLAWPPSVAERFFADGARELPKVRYRRFDASESLDAVAQARRLLGKYALPDKWLRRQARAIETSARMLAGVGTPDFFRHARALYGVPSDPVLDGATTSLALGKRLDRILARLDPEGLGPPVESIGAEELAARLSEETQHLLGEKAPRVVVVDTLSAKAVAGAKRIRIHAAARFTDNDVQQLLMHESMVHVATSLNGRMQRKLPVLGVGHPGTTKTQEGLAVFSELISGSMTPHRFRRLAGRVGAIQMSVDGANFLEVYRYFLERTDDPAQSFEDTRRVFRGGELRGGAPFPKDGVYLDGLMRVYNFLRAAVWLHRTDVVPLLFCGRLDIEDIPALAQLTRQKMCRRPKLLPPWARDQRFLVSYMAFSGFLNRMHFDTVRKHYAGMLAHC
ncbi:flavohemoglobin expression-modulating QEGLA motif protein [Haliangium ochraceum]|uniref:DUF1704 domain-containing protein n=1 Tax=Haliangium ochraceum (strain DSM 14365 / JCM 11303 / SMP-2) TaxID=502025 RepID=D0LJU8_HALO1|nr:flavohemoglobin expression-modulating QEGLA motif protein [Haliangium ochraceum]ACY18455.1 protein of unknown function DUF1704 [Haliangium ochraceum DSM 14365]